MGNRDSLWPKIGGHAGEDGLGEFLVMTQHQLPLEKGVHCLLVVGVNVGLPLLKGGWKASVSYP